MHSGMSVFHVEQQVEHLGGESCTEGKPGDIFVGFESQRYAFALFSSVPVICCPFLFV